MERDTGLKSSFARSSSVSAVSARTWTSLPRRLVQTGTALPWFRISFKASFTSVSLTP